MNETVHFVFVRVIIRGMVYECVCVCVRVCIVVASSMNPGSRAPASSNTLVSLLAALGHRVVEASDTSGPFLQVIFDLCWLYL